MWFFFWKMWILCHSGNRRSQLRLGLNIRIKVRYLFLPPLPISVISPSIHPSTSSLYGNVNVISRGERTTSTRRICVPAFSTFILVQVPYLSALFFLESSVVGETTSFRFLVRSVSFRFALSRFPSLLFSFF